MLNQRTETSRLWREARRRFRGERCAPKGTDGAVPSKAGLLKRALSYAGV